MDKIKFAATAAGVYRQGETVEVAIEALGAYAEYYDSGYAYAHVGKSGLATISPIDTAKTDVGAKRIASRMRKPLTTGKSYLLKLNCYDKWVPFATLACGKWVDVDGFVSGGI